MPLSVETLREKGAELAERMIAWLEGEGIPSCLGEPLASSCANSMAKSSAEFSSSARAVLQEALVMTARLFLLRCVIQFRQRFLWVFRRPDWEALGAAWDGFMSVVEPRLDEEQRELLEHMEIEWGPSGSAGLESRTSPRASERLERAIAAMRPADASLVTKRFLESASSKVNDLADEIFWP